MASKRKTFTPQGQTKGDAFAYAEFIADVLAGTITASKLIEKGRDGNGRQQFEYDDPNG